MSVQKIEGKVRRWNAPRGFGIIGWAEDGILREAWFSFSCTLEIIKRGQAIPAGTAVRFTLDPPKTGALPVARNVEIVGGTL